MKRLNYYEKQLSRLNGDVQVKFISTNGETKWLNMNMTTVKAIRDITTKLYNDKQINIPVEA